MNRTGTDRENVVLYRYHDGSWNEVETELQNENDGKLTYRAYAPGLSSFAVGAKKAVFRIKDARLTVERLYVGNETAVKVRIRNTGGADGTYTVRLLLEERVVDERQLTIAANETRLAVFERAFDEPGNYSLRVNNVTAGNVEVLRLDPGLPETGTETPSGESTPDTSTNVPRATTSATVGGDRSSVTADEDPSRTSLGAVGPGFGVLLTLLAVLLVGGYVRARR